jgi:hypothetical protein
LPDGSQCRGDVAWGGNWFFLVNDHEQELALHRTSELLAYSLAARDAVRRAGFSEVDHCRTLRSASQLTGTFTQLRPVPGGAYDRSPCGTGTSAKLACLAADGKLQEGAEWVQESIVGSRFTGRYRWVDRSNGTIAPEITGTAYVTAETTLLFDSADPFRCGIQGTDMSRHVVIVGAGVIGLCSAYYAQRRGLKVTVVERVPRDRDGCSFGNAGMVVPSHFIPLAAPGMVSLGLRWMWNPESPFYIKPRLSWDLAAWGWHFWRASTLKHVQKSAPLLRDLSFASRECFEELAPLEFGLERKGLLMLCRTEHGLDEEAATASLARELGVPADVLDAKQIAALEPGIAMNVAGGRLLPKGLPPQSPGFSFRTTARTRAQRCHLSLGD